jgi:hypothetical protein
MEKVEEKITEVKTHNGWKREKDVKERYENFIHIIKGKIEVEEKEKYEIKKKNQSVYGGTENAIT